jgi:hypothetical protein
VGQSGEKEREGESERVREREREREWEQIIETLELQFAVPGGPPIPANCNSKVPPEA